MSVTSGAVCAADSGKAALHQEQVPGDPSCPRRRRRFVAYVLFAVLIALAGVFHAAWLPLLADPLLSPSATEGNSGEFVWIRSDDGHSISPEAVHRAVQILQENPGAQILYSEGRPSRLVELGVIPPLVDVVRQAVQEQGISPERVHTFAEGAYELWYEAQKLDEWLQGHPQGQVVFYVEEFAGRSHALVLRSAMSEASYRRVSVVGIPRSQFTRDNWWKSRAGVKGFMVGYLYLFYSWVAPQPLSPPRSVSLEEIARRFPDRTNGPNLERSP